MALDRSPGFCLNFLHIGIYWKLTTPLVTPKLENFCKQGHNWNKSKRVQLGDAIFQIIRPFVLWFSFHNTTQFKTSGPKNGAISGHRATI